MISKALIWLKKPYIDGGPLNNKTLILVTNIAILVLRIKANSASEVEGGDLCPPIRKFCE